MGFSRKSYELLPWWARKLNWLILALVIISLLAYAGGFSECRAKTNGLNAEMRYNYYGGCLIRPEGAEEWFPLQNYRWVHPASPLQ